MDKIVFEDDLEEDIFEEKLRETAARRLLQLNIPPFTPTSDMKLARSVSEINKCIEKAERVKEKRAFIGRDKKDRKDRKDKKVDRKVDMKLDMKLDIKSGRKGNKEGGRKIYKKGDRQGDRSQVFEKTQKRQKYGR